MPILDLEISPVSKTSKPNRSGTLIKLSLLKVGIGFSVTTTSAIKSLAALLPISIAASFNIAKSVSWLVLIRTNLRLNDLTLNGFTKQIIVSL